MKPLTILHPAKARASWFLAGVVLLTALSARAGHAQSCKPADSRTASMLADFRRIADTTDASQIPLRTKLKLPAVPAAQIFVVRDESTCARAQQAVDSLIHSTNPNSPHPMPARALYVIRIGDVTAVNDPNGKAGEYAPLDLFDPAWVFLHTMLGY